MSHQRQPSPRVLSPQEINTIVPNTASIINQLLFTQFGNYGACQALHKEINYNNQKHNMAGIEISLPLQNLNHNSIYNYLISCGLIIFENQQEPYRNAAKIFIPCNREGEAEIILKRFQNFIASINQQSTTPGPIPVSSMLTFGSPSAPPSDSSDEDEDDEQPHYQSYQPTNYAQGNGAGGYAHANSSAPTAIPNQPLFTGNSAHLNTVSFYKNTAANNIRVDQYNGEYYAYIKFNQKQDSITFKNICNNGNTKITYREVTRTGSFALNETGFNMFYNRCHKNSSRLTISPFQKLFIAEVFYARARQLQEQINNGGLFTLHKRKQRKLDLLNTLGNKITSAGPNENVINIINSFYTEHKEKLTAGMFASKTRTAQVFKQVNNYLNSGNFNDLSPLAVNPDHGVAYQYTR